MRMRKVVCNVRQLLVRDCRNRSSTNVWFGGKVEDRIEVGAVQMVDGVRTCSRYVSDFCYVGENSLQEGCLFLVACLLRSRWRQGRFAEWEEGMDFHSKEPDMGKVTLRMKTG